MSLHECVADILKECKVDGESSSKIIIEIRDLETRLGRVEDMLEEVSDILRDHTALLIGTRSNGDFDFGLVYKYEQIKRELKFIKAGVWTIAAALLAALVKIIFFGGI